MRRQITSVPYRLPHARLFVDDLEAIEEVLSQAMKKVATERAEAAFSAAHTGKKTALVTIDQLVAAQNLEGPKTIVPAQIKITYKTNNIEMDSVDDLLEQGGSVTDLALRVGLVGSYSAVSVEFGGFDSRPSISLGTLRQEDQWVVYGKVQNILLNRRLILKPFIDDLPTSVKVGTWVVVTCPHFPHTDHTTFWSCLVSKIPVAGAVEMWETPEANAEEIYKAALSPSFPQLAFAFRAANWFGVR